MIDAAGSISCTARQQTIRAWKAVGLAKNVNEKTSDLLDETACLIDVYMRDSPYDTGQEPNWDACIDVDGGGGRSTPGRIGNTFGKAPTFGFVPPAMILVAHPTVQAE